MITHAPWAKVRNISIIGKIHIRIEVPGSIYRKNQNPPFQETLKVTNINTDAEKILIFTLLPPNQFHHQRAPDPSQMYLLVRPDVFFVLEFNVKIPENFCEYKLHFGMGKPVL